MVPTCTLILWTPEPPADLELDIAIQGKQGTTRIRPKVDAPKFGVSYNCSPTGELRVTQLDPQKSALVNVNYLDLINEDGMMQEQGYQNE